MTLSFLRSTLPHLRANFLPLHLILTLLILLLDPPVVPSILLLVLTISILLFLAFYDPPPVQLVAYDDYRRHILAMRDLRFYDDGVEEDAGEEVLPEYTVEMQGLVDVNSLGGVGEMAPKYEEVERVVVGAGSGVVV